jgi:hypothetical protein
MTCICNRNSTTRLQKSGLLSQQKLRLIEKAFRSPIAGSRCCSSRRGRASPSADRAQQRDRIAALAVGSASASDPLAARAKAVGQIVIVTIGSNMGTGPGGRYLGRSYTHINEISLQPPQTKRAMIRTTKRLAVNSSRPGCAVGGKSKPSSDSRASPTEDCEALSARTARVPVWAMRSPAK